MKQLILLLPALLCGAAETQAKTWKVGPAETYKFCSAVTAMVSDGDTVDIVAADYVNDAQAQWTRNNLLIRGVGGRPRLFAGSLIANDATNGKGIFVVKGNDCIIENIEFRDAKVQSHNGAGIRLEGSRVIVRRCRFEANEMGILGGGLSTLPNSTYIIEYCEFLNGGSTADPGYQHNIYINHVDSFIFRYNWSWDAIAQGHELKSRANHTYILYNRIANISSTDSRNIDIPNGGTAIIMGNIIEQGMNSTNSNMVAYGLEGFSNPGPHQVFICYNSFVNKKDKGSFIHVPASGCDTLLVKNNILAGPKTGGLILGTPTVLDSSNNYITDRIADLQFENAAGYNYRLKTGSPAIDKAVVLQKRIKGRRLHPDKSYSDTCNYKARRMQGSPDIGAYEYEAPAGRFTVSTGGEALKCTVQDGQLRIHNLPCSRVKSAFIQTLNGQLTLPASHNGPCPAGEPFTCLLDGCSAGIYVLVLETEDGYRVLKFALD